LLFQKCDITWSGVSIYACVPGMLTTPRKSEAEIEAEAEARVVAYVIRTPYMNACTPT